MVLNVILLSIIVFFSVILIKLIKKYDINLMPICNFIISEPEYIIDKNSKIAKFSITTKGNNLYFHDFPIGFKFYSNEKFKSKIVISYVEFKDNETEVIYDKTIEYDNTVKNHIYYINDVIMGTIDIKIYTFSEYGIPSILFEILQGKCRTESNNSLNIVFPD